MALSKTVITKSVCDDIEQTIVSETLNRCVSKYICIVNINPLP